MTTNSDTAPLADGLIRALLDHDLERIKRLTEQGSSLAGCDPDGNSALHLACMPRQTNEHSASLMQIALAATPSIHARNHHGWSALMLGTLLLPPSLLRDVQSHASQADREDSTQESLLLAANYGRGEAVSTLLSGGARSLEPSPTEARPSRGELLERHRALLKWIDALLGKFPVFDQAIADRTDIDPQELVHLARSSDKGTRKKVTSNPNTPSATLIKLASEFPRAFYKNPSFEWLLLEDPDLLKNHRGGILKHIAGLADCPESILDWTARNGNEAERLAVARRKNVSRDLLAIVSAGAPGHAASIAAARNPDSSPQLLSTIARHARLDDALDRLLSVHPNADAHLLDKLSSSADATVREQVRDHPNTSPETRRRLIEGSHGLIHRMR